MTKATMQFLSAALHEIDAEHEVSEHYSGRGMYGEKTCSITLANITALIPAVAAFTHENDAKPPDCLLTDCDGFRVDNMGRDWVIY